MLGLAACSSGAAREADTPGSAANARVVTQRTLPDGARIDATMRSQVSSRTDSAGETVEAVVSNDVTNRSGVVVIPAGTTVLLRIVALDPAQDQGDHDGRLALAPVAAVIDGTSYPVVASMAPVKFTLVGRGLTSAEAARIGAGTAIGAVAGQVIGKNTKSTVIGGAVGAVAGTAVALRYAKRDVVVAAGTPVVLTLTQVFSVFAK
jgi:hypothetical protein